MAGMENAIVDLRDIRVQYGNYVAVNDVSLRVAKGEVVAIVGPSGAGKSTLLRSINMLEKPVAGSIEVAGYKANAGQLTKTAELVALRRRTGMVFQSFNLFPHMTVQRNISLPQQRVLGKSKQEADATTSRLLEQVKLADKAHSYPARLSGGQQQRIAIARALALEPDVMLFDEPTSALDPELGLEVLAVMRQLAAQGMTMIIVTHEIAFAADVADRMIVMADGQIVEQGPAKELMQHAQSPRTRQFFRAVLERQ